jgi:transforming growth factor-beta-induced protein
MTNRARTIKLLAACASLSLVAAACGSDSNDDAATDAPAATEAPAATDAPTETMTEETMAEETMTEDTMADETMTEDTMAEDTMAEETMTGETMTEDAPFGPACSAVPADGEGSFAGMTDDPAATAASNNPLLSTLVTAVTAAGLVDTLNSDGPFTIFAPTNDAFAAIPPADLEAVLADTELLTSILTYHVIAGESLDAAALGEMGSAATVNGGTLEFSADGTQVNGVDVLCSNVVTANATVHIIGEVLMPA